MEKWRRHLGVYGVYIEDGKILLVHKTRGPYKGKYDLPGGSLNANETILQALNRELLEETGHTFNIQENIRTRDFIVPWISEENCTHIHHIAILFKVDLIGNMEFKELVADDTSGYEMIEITKLSKENSSPLVVDLL